MGMLYNGVAFSKKQVGQYVNGNIYSGFGYTETLIGHYDNSIIYDAYKNQLGSYENGIIYSGWGWNKNPIGEYSNGIVYIGRGIGRDSVGEYEGAPAGGAAFLLLFYGKQNISNDSLSYHVNDNSLFYDKQNTSDDSLSHNTNDNSGSDIECGLVTTILGTVVGIIAIVGFIYVTSIVPFTRSILNKYHVFLAIILNLISLRWLNKKIIKINLENFICVIFYEIMLNAFIIFYSIFVKDSELMIGDNNIKFFIPILYYFFSTASAFLMTKLHNNSYTLYTISGVSSFVIGEFIIFRTFLNDIRNIKPDFFVYMFIALLTYIFVYLILAFIIFYISKIIIPPKAINKIKMYK